MIPLLSVNGRDISSKQIAEAAGVAEGTVFRAFGNKDSVIDAAIAKFLDPEPLSRDIRAIDPSVDLDTKVHTIIELLRRRFGEVFRVMTIVGHDRHAHPKTRTVVSEAITDVLAPDAGGLNWPAAKSAQIIRLVTFASAFPHLSDGDELSTEELAAFVLHGIARSTTTPAQTLAESHN